MFLGISFNTKALTKDLLRMQSKIDDNLNKAVRDAGLLIQGQAKQNISRGARSGATYRRRSVMHRASAMGEYPKSDTGNLVKNIFVEFGNKRAIVGTPVIYGAYLENGDPAHGGRPWLSRTYEENKYKVEKLYVDAIRKALK